MSSLKPQFSDRTRKGVREFLHQAYENRAKIEADGGAKVAPPKRRLDDVLVPSDAEYKALKAIKGKLKPQQLKRMQAHPDMAGPTLTMRQKFTRTATLRKAAEVLANEKPNHVMLPLPEGIKPLSAADRALIPQGLSAQERRVYEIILGTAAAKREAGVRPNHKFHLGDFGKDLDDNACTPINKELSRTGVKIWEGNVAVLGEDHEEVDGRAALSEAIVKELGMADQAWVVPGTLGSSDDHRAHVTE
ncbi:MAG TPA: hypothetical protein VFH51_03980, partial [Myxococcota bacterium]|nr:hypothetical protein [Myxococcota bacterium]